MNKALEIKDGNKVLLSGQESKVFTLILNSEKVHLDYAFEDGDYKVLIYNHGDFDVEIIDEGYLKNANVEITYLELGSFEYHQKSHIEVLEGSNLVVHSIYLSNSLKNIHFNLVNNAPHTEVQIDNSAVCLKDSHFDLKVEGSIKKGAYDSRHFQRSHCLTVEKPKRAYVAPILNIDENDVQASHSLSSGTIDEEILYYMNARGLNRTSAILLMIQSYLLPDHEFFMQFEKGEEIASLVERKVEQLCTM